MKNKWKGFEKLAFYVGTFILWGVTSVLAIWEIFIARALAVRITTSLLMDRAGLSKIMATVWAYRAGVVAVLVMTVIALIIVLGGADFRYDSRRGLRSWKLFFWIIGFQIIVLGMSFIW